LRTPGSGDNPCSTKLPSRRYDHDDGWREHEWREHRCYRDYYGPRVVYVYPGYYAPGYYYASPAVSFGFSFR
jgi:hypothetical protein